MPSNVISFVLDFSVNYVLCSDFIGQDLFRNINLYSMIYNVVKSYSFPCVFSFDYLDNCIGIISDGVQHVITCNMHLVTPYTIVIIIMSPIL